LALSGLLLIRLLKTKHSTPFLQLGVLPTARQSAVVLTIGLWTLFMSTLGFALSSLLAFTSIMLIANFDKPKLVPMLRNVSVSVVIVAAFYLLMKEVLLLRMPAGILF
jgi:putative tricarboxylic transport membrane protein